MTKRTRTVKIGDKKIGGSNPVLVQSMTKTHTNQIAATIKQIHRLEKAGCELIRVAVVNKTDVAALKKIKASISIPLIADIHFDYRLALASIDAGVDKIRINPGNIGEDWKVRAIIEKARAADIPIRIGVNSGSLPSRILKKYKTPTPAAIIAAVKESVRLFEKNHFFALVLSAKAVNVQDTIKVYETLRANFDYPLHIGITEAGLPFRGGIKSAVGLGILLSKGIGDTIRVSLTGDPIFEVIAAYEILAALGLRNKKPLLISCPTCGRCQVDLVKLARKVERRLRYYDDFIKVAVMGCVVNGPGEARVADFGIACGKGRGIIFSKGKEIKRTTEARLVDTLFEVIDAHFNHR